MATTNQNPEPQYRYLVRKAIRFDAIGYDNLIHRNFVTWCEILSMKFFYVDRDLITNNILFKYYQNQWAILVENRLIVEYGDYLKKEIDDTQNVYYKIVCEYAQELENFYPASLLPATKTKINNKYQFNQN